MTKEFLQLNIELSILWSTELSFELSRNYHCWAVCFCSGILFGLSRVIASKAVQSLTIKDCLYFGSIVSATDPGRIFYWTHSLLRVGVIWHISVDSVLDQGPRVPGLILSCGNTFFKHPRRPRILMRPSHRVTFSIWGTRVQAESLQMRHPDKCCVKDSVDQRADNPHK